MYSRSQSSSAWEKVFERRLRPYLRMFPEVRVGERAIISGVNGFSILTSPILTILEVSNDSIVFETENTIYHLVHTPETVSEVMCA